MRATIEFEISPIDEAEDALIEAVKSYFINQPEDIYLYPDVEVKISKYLEPFKDDLFCFIEYPYVDKVYRDSYYNYFSSKHSTYQRDCIRVSLFKSEITDTDFLDTSKHEQLSEKYLGFFVLRPTLSAIFGRSIISPKAFETNGFSICKCKTNTLVYGVKLEAEGFPHSSQDKETILCAETTVWGLMEYFSNKYAEYKPTLPSKIHKVLEKVIFQRQLPSRGLSMDETSYALKEFGFGTRIYSTSSYGTKIYNILDCYIESGIPLLVGLGMDGVNIGHVVVAIGKQYQQDIDFDLIKKDDFKRDGEEKIYIDFTNFPKNYIVQDDNLPPYSIIDINRPCGEYEEGEFHEMKVDSIVVPLYSKIYLEAELAKELFIQIIKDEKIGYNFENNFIMRYFLTSSRAFKRHIGSLSSIENGLKYNILATKMPKFVWCCEIYLPLTNPNKDVEAIGLVILDATEANKTSIDALIFAGYPDRCINMNENKFVDLQYIFKKYIYFSNLK